MRTGQSESHIRFLARQGRTSVAALDHARILASSSELKWQGLHLEIAANRGWDVDDLMVDGHFVAINLGHQDMQFEALGDAGWTAARMPPGTLWINPEGMPFSVRSHTLNRWAGAVIDGEFLDTTIGRHHELRSGFAIDDAVIANLMRALVAEIENRGASGHAVARTIIQAFVTAVGVRHGEAAAELPVKGGIAGHQLKSVLNWIETHLGEPITVPLMAQHVGLSPAHFSREFKQTTGSTPWGYVLEMRLEHACRLLKRGDTICDVAARCGFADQAHFGRVFRQRLGISPSNYLRAFARTKEDSDRPTG